MASQISFKDIDWTRLALNTLVIFLIVFASGYGNSDNFFIAIKAGFVTAILAFARELQAIVGDNGNGLLKDQKGFFSKIMLW